jgi:hypothetical protein
MACPLPIGTVPKEDCAAIAADFGAMTVQGALPLAAAGQHAEPKVEAIRAVAALAQSIKDRRVKLCERYAKCTVPLSEHDAEDQALTASMHALIDLWNKRRFSSLGDVARFRAAVLALDVRVNGAADGARPPPPPPRTLKAEEVLTRVEDPGVAFRAEAGAVTVTSSTDGKRDALIAKADALGLSEGHRYHVTLAGAYRPASPPLIAPGDELVARLKYKAEGEASLALSLRSLDDPEGAESTETWRAASGDKAVREVKLTADPQQNGFYLGFTVKGSPVAVDALELLRGGNVIVAAKAGEPTTRTDCTAGKAVTGGSAHPLHCVPGEGDRVTLAQPQGYLIVTVRDASGPRASLKALSLEGGRSLDATVGADAQIVFTLVGAGAATVERLEIADLGI